VVGNVQPCFKACPRENGDLKFEIRNLKLDSSQ